MAIAQTAAVLPPFAPAAKSRSIAPAVLAGVGIIFTLGTIMSVLALHVVGPSAQISPIRRTISEYAYASNGWVFNGAVIALAIGSLLITTGLWLTGRIRPISIASLGILLWSLSLVLLVIFPKHDWSVGPSSHGMIHRVASLVAFISLPIAAFSTGRRSRGVPQLKIAARVTMLLALISAAWFSVIAGAALLAPITGIPWYRAIPLGLFERGVALFEVLAVIAAGYLAVKAARISRLRS